MGIVNVALAVKAWWLAKAATGMTTAAIATGAFSTALKLIPFVAIAAGIGLIIAGITETDSSYRSTTPVVTSFGQAILKTGQDAEWAAGKYGVLKSSLDALPKNVKINVALETTSRNNQLDQYLGFLGGRAGSVSAPAMAAPTISSGGGGASIASGLGALIADANKNARVTKKETTLVKKGLDASVAAWITSSNTPIKAANEAIARVSKNGAKAIANLTKAYNKSTAGQQAAASAAASAAAEASAAAAQAAYEMQAAQEAAARAAQEAAEREAAALAERERVYESFLDSVKSTFAGIRNSILGAFDLPQLGGSTNAITRNMDKLLVRLRAFATNVKSLAGMGLDPALLQQVISAGPMAGARLAESLVMGGTGALAAINAGYSEFGVLSGQIAQTGTESLFNREAQQTVYNINVDGGVGSGATIGKAIVDAIKAYERTSGAVWQGA
jgi:hypothetical protein